MSARLLPAVFVAFATLLLIAAYWAGLHGAFFFDDQPNILEVAALRINGVSFDGLLAAWESGHAGPWGRPVAQISFALNYWWAGFDPFKFKVVNLAIHGGNACLLACLVRRIFSRLAPAISPAQCTWLALVCASIWMFHPLQMTSVLYVVQRMTSLSALFLMTGLLLHIRAREGAGTLWQLLVAWGIAFPLACLSKETGALFPLFVIAWEVLVFGSIAGLRERGAGVSFWCLVVLALSIGALLVWRYLPLIQEGYIQRPFSLGERLLTEARVVWQYLAWTVYPQLDALGLHHDDFVLSRGIWAPPTTAFAIVGVVGLAVIAYCLRSIAPAAAFGLAWFLVGHLLESTVLPLELVHEHRHYLPMAGLMFVFGQAGLWGGSGSNRRRRWSTLVLGAFAAYLLLITALRSHMFGDEFRRTQIEAQHHRKSSRAQYDAGRVLAGFPEARDASSSIHAMARSHFEIATDADPDFKLGLLGVVELECRATGAVSTSVLGELGYRMGNGPYSPGDNAVLFGLREMALQKDFCLLPGQVEEIFTQAATNPKARIWVRQQALSWLADYFWLGRRDATSARRVLVASLELAPWHPGTRLKLAQIDLLEGRLNEAAEILRQLETAPLSVEERLFRKELLEGLEKDHLGR